MVSFAIKNKRIHKKSMKQMDGKMLCLMTNLIMWKTHSKIHCLDINVQGIEPYDLTFKCSR
jgi:hypothetical protein